MAQIIGQVYNQEFLPAKKDEQGNTKQAMIRFSVGTQRAFKQEDATKNKVFTRCEAYGQTAEFIAKHFADHGKGIIVYGNFEDRTWVPDSNNEQHKKFWLNKEITADFLKALGFQLAEGSPQSVKVDMFCDLEQTSRVLVVNNVDFLPFTGDASSTGTGQTKSSNAGFRIPGQESTGSSDVPPVNADVADSKAPF